ncbi:MAG: asparaginase [bacterium]|nr:MAG: asparaginase [bacterium]
MRILLVSTGGTIAMKRAEGETLSTFALESADFVREAGMEGVEVRGHDFSRSPSSSFQTAFASRLAAFIAASDHDAFVVTHGTDTLEETAFYLEMVLPADRPVVLTGAMVTPDRPGADGEANLRDALRVAADPASAGRGVLVVFGGDIIWGLYARKVQTLKTRAFGSARGGMLGTVEAGRVLYHYGTRTHSRLDNRPGEAVALVKVHYDIEDQFLRDAYGRYAGVVIEGLGGGRVPERLLKAVDENPDRLTLVTTRVQDGGLGDEYSFAGSYQDLSGRPIVFSPFDALKTCILARLALGNGLDRQALADFLASFWDPEDAGTPEG